MIWIGPFHETVLQELSTGPSGCSEIIIQRFSMIWVNGFTTTGHMRAHNSTSQVATVLSSDIQGSVNWVNENMSPVDDQWSCGSCYGFANVSKN